MLTYILIAILVVILILRSLKKPDPSHPPFIPSAVPFLGNAIAYGLDPVKFLADATTKYGNCFTFELFGRKLTFCLGPDGNNAVFNARLTHASAEKAYKRLTAPVFGSGVVYDCDNALLMQQKKMAKDALTVQAFKSYVPLMIKETDQLINEWNIESGEIDCFTQMAELTIRTASTCLLGKEIRSQLASNVAQLYHDLDGGFTPLNMFISWLPTPRYFKRDRANKIMTETFVKIILERRKNKDFNNKDVLQTFMDTDYKDGTRMNDVEIAHMMIALLMAGQHTRLAQNPEVIEALRKEQTEVLKQDPNTPWNKLASFDYDDLKQFTILDYVMKETLRLHPPIHTIMRYMISDLEYKGMTIPKGHYICAAPAVSQLDPEKFPDPDKFDPFRHEATEDSGEWNINGVDIAQKSAKSHYLPFGAGRHRCIGEAFAYVQVKSIVVQILRHYDIMLSTDKKTGNPIFPEKDYTTLIVLPVKGSKLLLKKRSTV